MPVWSRCRRRQDRDARTIRSRLREIELIEMPQMRETDRTHRQHAEDAPDSPISPSHAARRRRAVPGGVQAIDHLRFAAGRAGRRGLTPLFVPPSVGLGQGAAVSDGGRGGWHWRCHPDRKHGQYVRQLQRERGLRRGAARAPVETVAPCILEKHKDGQLERQRQPWRAPEEKRQRVVVPAIELEM